MGTISPTALNPGLERLDSETAAGLKKLGFAPRGPLADRHGSFMRVFLRQLGDEAYRVAAFSVTPVNDDKLALVFELGAQKDLKSVRAESTPYYYKIHRFRSEESFPHIAAHLKKFMQTCGDPNFWASVEGRLPSETLAQPYRAPTPEIAKMPLEV